MSGSGWGGLQSGEGAALDVAMLDCLVAMLPTSHALHLYAGQSVARVGNRHPLSTPFGGYRTADGHVIIAVLGARQFAALCRLVGRPEAADDPRFATDEGRTAHEPEIRALIGAIGAGDEVSVLGCIDSANWCQVSGDGLEGWAYGDYLNVKAGDEVVSLYPNRETVGVIACGEGQRARYLVVEGQGEVAQRRRHEEQQIGDDEQRDGRQPACAATGDVIGGQQAGPEEQRAKTAPDPVVEVGQCAEELAQQVHEPPIGIAQAGLAAGGAIRALQRCAAVGAVRGLVRVDQPAQVMDADAELPFVRPAARGVQRGVARAAGGGLGAGTVGGDDDDEDLRPRPEPAGRGGRHRLGEQPAAAEGASHWGRATMEMSPAAPASR